MEELNTIAGYWPRMGLPMYAEIAYPEHDSFPEEGEEQTVRVRDGGELIPQHEAVVVSVRKEKVKDINPYLLAFCANTDSMSEVRERISPSERPVDMDREVYVVVYLRVDKAEEFVKNPDNFDPVIKHPDKVTDEDYNPEIGRH